MDTAGFVLSDFGFLTPDELRFLKRKSMQGSCWSTETVKRALQLRFACGSSGYETERKN